MASLFVYGTLRHRPLLDIVLGRSLADRQVQRAHLPDHQVYWAADQAFPLITSATDAQAQGLLLVDLTQQDLARLASYENGFGYHMAPVTVTTVQGACATHSWFPDAGLWQAGPPWELQDWISRWGRTVSAAAVETMDYVDTHASADVARIYPAILARAASLIAAQDAEVPDDPALPDSGLRRTDVSAQALVRPYADFFAVQEHHLTFRRFDGSDSALVKRAVFCASDAAILLPYDPQRDRVMLLEQFRAGPFARGDHAPWALEPVAGRIDPGETPEVCARREAEEEAGLILHSLETVSRNYPSPGSTSEYFHIFVGLCALPDRLEGTGGLASEDEDIRTHILPYAQFLDLLDRDMLNVGPLVLAGHWLARHRDRLRAAS